MTTWAGHPPHKLRKFHFHVRFFSQCMYAKLVETGLWVMGKSNMHGTYTQFLPKSATQEFNVITDKNILDNSY